ncbi:MAG: NACHT domain-containing protein [Symploca sp. SIO2E9]|nr:NACHT domain-containing protein [Symploca sp. SIO2E9]
MPEEPKKVSNNDLQNSQFAGGFVDAETVNAHQIGGDIYNIALNQQPTLTRQEYRNRQALLNKVKKDWVKGVLEKSLYNQVLIEWGLEERPDAIANPWSVILETEESSPQPLPAGTKIIDIFDQIGAGRTLLILGEPGAGKTTTLLELTRDLIARAQQDINLLIPVVLNLSSWANKRQKIADWLVEELNTFYSVPKKIGQAWVSQQELLPLLDGLDEVKAEYRDDCILALNQFKQDYGAELVVCSRIKDYEALSNRLNFQSAVYLKSLTLEQICHYLDSVGADLKGLRTLIAEDRVLQELAQSPLMLHIMTLAYRGVAVEDLPRTNVAVERRRQLFDAYIEKMFKRRKTNQRYKRAQVKHWLIWLAQRMLQESQTIFLIETIQPTYLENINQKIIYIIVNFLIFILIFSLFFIIWLDLITTLILSTLFGLILAIYDKKIEIIESLKVTFKQVRFGAIAGLIIWLIFAIVLGINFGPKIGLKIGVIFGLGLGIICGTGLGIMFSRQRGLQIGTRTAPNQGIWRTVQNTAIFLLSILIGMGLSMGLGILMSLVLIERENLLVNLILSYNLKFGLSFILAFGLLGSGKACIQHFTLRLILYFNNYIPWNYARFLDYCAERIFLQKVGGGYIFIHRMLLEHFAQMELEN